MPADEAPRQRAGRQAREFAANQGWIPAGTETGPPQNLEVWRAVFDVAVSSMNSGSGFCDDSEVEALRAAAVLLGVPPDNATPQRFRCKYRGHHAAYVFLDRPMFTGADGLPRNAYRLVQEYPEAERHRLTGLREGDSLGKLRAPVLRMFCPDCTRSWEALEEIPPVNVQVST